ncbi:S41 family peptidase, partial [Steroidobacter sp.]|uniref:S41 family peptidase n=1 Tax=Steroidobacter sp. TaxID=1978227 RepID=UPI001A4F29CC
EAGYKAAIRRHVTQDVLHGRFKDAADQALTWGWAAPGVGYLQVDNMLKGEVSLPERLRRIDAGMELALKDLARAKALIVDARFNGGGRDAVSLRIAGYFTAERRLAFTKKAVLPDGYTEPQPIYIEPHGKQRFLKPILYLQSGNTVSAAEIFTLAMRALPNARSIGTPTYGVLSDTLPKQLPNGWVVTLSNEMYVAADGVCYESVGIPPQVPIETDGNETFSQRLERDTTMALREAQR